MEATLQSMATFMVEKGGFLGIACFVLGAALWRVFDLLMKSLERRIEDGGKTTAATITALNDTATALDRLTEVIKAGRVR